MRKQSLIRVTAVFMLLAIVFAACGCSVKTKRQLMQYARDKYGDATLVGAHQKLKGNDSVVTVTMQDNDTGIEYTVTSEMVPVTVDGGNMGYTEHTSSNFEQLYYDYLIAQAKDELDALADKYSLTYEFQQGMLELKFNDREASGKAKEASEGFEKVLGEHDVKNLRPNIYYCSVGDTINVGYYDAETREYSMSNDYSVIDYVLTNYDSEAVYLDSMTAYINQFLSNQEVKGFFQGQSSDPMGTAYYFKDKNGDIFVAIDMEEFGAKTSGIRLFRDTASGMEEIDY